MDNEIDPRIPNGVIIAPKPEDWAEGDGNLEGVKRILVPGGDWTPYIPKGERQRIGNVETNNCTAFGYANTIEVQFKRLRNEIPASTLTWLSNNGYLDENGDLNISDRALGTMAGSIGNGNSLNKVADTARTLGLIPESKWGNEFNSVSDYYKPIPHELLNLAKEFLNHFDLPYEKVFGPVSASDLEAAPLYVALVTCSPWSKPPVKWCSREGSNHSVTLVKANAYRIYDSYDPYVKDLATNYSIPYFYRVLLIPKGQQTMQLVRDTKSKTVGIYTGNRDNRILAFADVEALGLLGDEPQIPMDFSAVPIYNIVKKNPNGQGFIIVNK